MCGGFEGEVVRGSGQEVVLLVWLWALVGGMLSKIDFRRLGCVLEGARRGGFLVGVEMADSGLLFEES